MRFRVRVRAGLSIRLRLHSKVARGQGEAPCLDGVRIRARLRLCIRAGFGVRRRVRGSSGVRLQVEAGCGAGS